MAAARRAAERQGLLLPPSGAWTSLEAAALVEAALAQEAGPTAGRHAPAVGVHDAGAWPSAPSAALGK